MMINHHVHEDLHAIVFGEGVLQLKLNMHNLIKLIKIIFYINKIKSFTIDIEICINCK